MKKLLPILLILLGVGGGIGAGFALRPAPAPLPDAEAEAETAEALFVDNYSPALAASGEANGDREYVEMEDQFVVPVVKDGEMVSLVLISLSLETKPGIRDAIMQKEPRLRGGLLQVMFDHANAGGFDGAFTNSSKLEKLRRNFREVAQLIYGEDVSDVLVVEMTRQDL